MARGMANIGAFVDETNAQEFRIQQAIDRMWTACPVAVVAVDAPHFVDVKPLIQQRDGEGNSLPSATLYHVPYSRIQGGKNALVIDPQAGDIGWCVFAMRDISVLKETKTATECQMGSFRSYDPSDGIYLGGMLNAAPERWVQVSDDGVDIEGVAKVHTHGQQVTIDCEQCVINSDTTTVNASSQITLNSPLVQITGSLQQTGAAASGSPSSFTGGFTNTGGTISSNGIVLDSHTHGGVEKGNSSTGGPQ